MNIVFVTTQSKSQSTVVGRVLPLASEFEKMRHTVTVFVHDEASAAPSHYEGGGTGGYALRITGKNPFAKTHDGKKRQSGFGLLVTMKLNALRAAWALVKERPDVIVLVKPLPENTLAVLLAKLFLWKTKVVLDVDDFELFANKLTSLFQRAAVHASERLATRIATNIVVATPFLYDHMHQMVAGKKNITLIPTGLNAEFEVTSPIESTGHTLLYIGSISLSSGHRVDLLPEILDLVKKQIPDVRLTIAGTGDDEAALEKQFQVLSLEHAVTFTGKFVVSDVADLVASSDVIIDPIDASIVSRAKSSFRCALALRTGKAVVTSNIGIRTELLPSSLHDKFFATPADPVSYASRVVELMNNPLSKPEIAEMQKQSEKYIWSVLAKSYMQQIL